MFDVPLSAAMSAVIWFVSYRTAYFTPRESEQQSLGEHEQVVCCVLKRRFASAGFSVHPPSGPGGLAAIAGRAPTDDGRRSLSCRLFWVRTKGTFSNKNKINGAA